MNSPISCPDSKAFRLSIVIATLNRSQLLDTCLQSLHKALLESDWIICDVILVDQSEVKYIPSRDFCFELKILNAPIGASLARNVGLRQASGDYVWFLDDDAQVVRFPRIATDELKRSSILFATWLEHPCHNIRVLDRSPFSKLWAIRMSATFCYILKRELAVGLNGFDEKIGPGCQIGAGEDLDLLIRAYSSLQARQPVVIAAIVSHPNGQKPRPKRRSYAIARGFVLAKNGWGFIIAWELLYSLVFLFQGGGARFRWILKGRSLWISIHKQVA